MGKKNKGVKREKKKGPAKEIVIVRGDASEFAGDDDWIRAGRLKAKADAGDKAAARELDAMQNCRMISNDDLEARIKAKEDKK